MILESMQDRDTDNGISTAARYCTGSEVQIKAASKQLIYQGPGSGIVEKSISTFDFDEREYFSFDNILTTRSQDRDGDIVEPAGLVVDPALVLLWQHDQKIPLGRMFEIVESNKNLISLRTGIAPTRLGNEAAMLVEMGALKVSQGFKPTRAEALEKKRVNGKQVVTAWHVFEAYCLEHSLVSIPANADAVITAFYKKKLNDPVTQKLAKDYIAKKPKAAPGFRFDSFDDNFTTEIKIKF